MPKLKMSDVVVLLPGITGSELKRDGDTVWGFRGATLARALLSRGGTVREALTLDEDPVDAEDLGDGIVATGVLPDVHLIPGLWKIDGYSGISKAIRGTFDVEPGRNYFEFPYDWRRDNRVAARRLAEHAMDWLTRWRNSENGDAKLILLAHSMGGLISRYFLEVLGGWRDTRVLVTFGTPYRGSLNALRTLVEGVRYGPLGVIELTDAVRSFTSVYQLLPVYKCVGVSDQPATEGPSGEGPDSARPDADDVERVVRVAEAVGLPHVDPVRAADALAFHDEIRLAVDTNRQEAGFDTNGYRITPIVGIRQPTLQFARLSNGKVSFERAYEGEDLLGDGTVPRVSATPLELSNDHLEVFVSTSHGGLQNAPSVLTHLEGLLSGFEMDLGQFRLREGPGAPAQVTLDVDDLYDTREPVVLRARPTREDVGLGCTVKAHDTDQQVFASSMRESGDGWLHAECKKLSPGAYTLAVHGEDADTEPASESFLVVQPEP